MNNDDRAKFEALTDEQIDRIADSDECNPDKGGWGPKFDHRAFARAILASAQAASAEPVAPCDVQMPSYWRVAVEDSEGLVLAIDQHGFTGHVDLAAREATVIGAAKHLLSFIGYGLPPSNFDPEADTTPAPAVAPTDPLDTPLPCKVDLGGMSFGKGVALRTLIDAARRWREDAYGPKPSPEEAARNLALLQGAAVAAVTDEQIDALFKHLQSPVQIGPDPYVKLRSDEFRETAHCILALAARTQEPQAEQGAYSYASKQATECAGCGKRKHTPLRIDAMGGYVCLTCIDQKLGTLLGEFGYPQPEPQPDSRGQAREGCGRIGTSALAWGVSRMEDNDRAVLVSFRTRPTDDDLRLLHEALRPTGGASVHALAASPTPDEQRAQADKQPISDATRTSEQELIRRAVDSVRLFDQEPLTLLTVSTRHPQDYVLTNEADGTRWRGTADGKWLDEQRAQAAQENEEGLLPCPFCGSDEVSRSMGEKGDGTPWPYIECIECGACTEPDVWNRRAALAGRSK